MMTLAQYLKRQNAAITLLAEIDYDTAEPVRVSNLPYVTEPTDSDANVLYSPVIKAQGLPRLSQRLRDLWGGLAVGSWGDLELVSHRVNHNGDELNLATYGLRGRSIRLRITGPRARVAYSEAQTIFVGRISESVARSDGTLRLTLEDTSAAWLDTVLPPDRYDAASMAAELLPSGQFPASNDGRPRPLLLGKVAHCRPVLIDSINHTYEFDAYSGAATIYMMYDNGAEVAFTDNEDGTATLANPPVGVITGTAEVTVNNGTNTNEEWQIADALLATYGGVSTLSHWTSGVTGLSAHAGIYLTEGTTLGEVINRIARGMFGWCAVAPDGAVSLQALDVPATTVGRPQITAAKRLGDVEWRDVAARYDRVPTLYQKNWSPLETVADSVAASPDGSPALGTSNGLDTAEYLRSEGKQGAAVSASALLEAPRLNTLYFDSALAHGDAVSAAQRALALLGVPRRRVSFNVPWAAWDWSVGLGGSIQLADASVDGDYLITAFSRTTVDGIPALTIEAIG